MWTIFPSAQEQGRGLWWALLGRRMRRARRARRPPLQGYKWKSRNVMIDSCEEARSKRYTGVGQDFGGGVGVPPIDTTPSVSVAVATAWSIDTARASFHFIKNHQRIRIVRAFLIWFLTTGPEHHCQRTRPFHKTESGYRTHSPCPRPSSEAAVPAISLSCHRAARDPRQRHAISHDFAIPWNNGRRCSTEDLWRLQPVLNKLNFWANVLMRGN